MLLLPITAVAFRLIGFRRWQSVLTRLSKAQAAPGQDQSQDSLERAYLTTRMVSAAQRNGLGRPNCLQLSLVLWWLLRRQGIPSELRIGARKQANRFEAHAWVEHHGVILNDGEDLHRHFTPLKDSIAAAHAEPR